MEQIKDFLTMFCMALAATIPAFILYLFIATIECSSKTSHMEYNSKITTLGTCMIEIESGTWIPLENYRVIN